MINVAEISYSKTFLSGNLEGITVEDQIFWLPINEASDRVAQMQNHAVKRTVFNDTMGSGKFTISNIGVTI